MPVSEYPFLGLSRGSLDEAAVASLEAGTGFRLPDDYREFLLQTNGGWSEWRLVPPGSHDERSRWCHFYGVHTRSRWENLASAHHLSDEVLDDESLLLIADSCFEFLALRSHDSRVYYINKVSSERRNGFKVLRASELASSFRGLCAMLRRPELPRLDRALMGRADPHPLRKLLKQSMPQTVLNEIASTDYGQFVAENLISMQSLLDDGPGSVCYLGGDVWECWLISMHVDDEEPHADLIRLFATFGLLGEVALASWVHVENADPDRLVERFATSAKALGRAWHEPAVLFLRWSASLAPPNQDKTPWRNAIRSLWH